MTLWSGRFDTEPDPAAFDFGISFAFDRALFEDDVTGSLARAEALGAAGVLSKEDAAAIKSGLGLSTAQFSLVLLFAAIGAVFSFPVTAAALHKFGSRGASLVAGVLLPCALLGLGFAPNLATACGVMLAFVLEWPDAPVVAHPECTYAVRLLADEVCSTEKMISYCRDNPSPVFIIATESGMLNRLRHDLLPALAAAERDGVEEHVVLARAELLGTYKR